MLYLEKVICCHKKRPSSHDDWFQTCYVSTFHSDNSRHLIIDGIAHVFPWVWGFDVSDDEFPQGAVSLDVSSRVLDQSLLVTVPLHWGVGSWHLDGDDEVISWYHFLVFRVIRVSHDGHWRLWGGGTQQLAWRLWISWATEEYNLSVTKSP